MEHLLLFFVSLIANFFSALAGGGAGLIQFPVLIFLGLPFGVALATHKVASVALGVGATTRHLKESHFNFTFCCYVIATGLPGVVMGAYSILEVPEFIAQIALGLLTIGLGVYSIIKKTLGQHYQPKNFHLNGQILGGIAIFAIGFLNGSLTSGTGLFLTMWLIQWFGLDYKRAVAYTLVLVGLVWNFTGALTLGLIGEIKWDWVPALLAGSFVGGYLGAHLSITKGNALIKRAFEVITILMGLSLIVKSVM